MPRRSISQSLTAREIEFIRAPLTEAKTKESSPKVSESKKTPKKQKPVSTPSETPATSSNQPQATSKPTGSQQPWATITTRLPSSLHSRLRRAAFERSERDQEPNTIQDILAAAAKAWLETNEPRMNVIGQANKDLS